MELLGLEKSTLDDLRYERGFPYYRITARCRVYLAREVLDWLTTNCKTTAEDT
jgi:predicted DNA-binding transcriptional regulator AlpA